MSADLTKLRSLGNLEKYHALKHHIRFYTGVGIAATYVLPSSGAAPGRSLKTDIYRACEIAIQQHPSLSVNVVLHDDKTNAPYFVRLPEINLDECVVFEKCQSAEPRCNSESISADAEVDELFQKHLNTYFEPGAPLWKLCILDTARRDTSSPASTFTAAFIFHHAIGDGTSGKVFHTTFAQALDEVLQSPSTDARNVVTPPATISLPPKLEDAMDLSLSTWFLLKELYKSKFPSAKPGLWGGTEHQIVPKDTTLVNRIKHLVIPAQTARSLRRACSANKATVTAFLQILLARLLFRQIDDRKYTQLAYQGSMSARRWILNTPNIDNLIGDFPVDYGEIYHRRDFEAENDGDFPWSQAQAAKASLAEKLASKGKNTGVGLLKYVSDLEKEVFRSHIDQPRESSFEISNLGAFELLRKSDASSSSEKVSIGRMIFTQSSGITGAAIVVSVISGGDGCLSLAFSWQEAIVNSSFVEELMNCVTEEIAKIAS